MLDREEIDAIKARISGLEDAFPRDDLGKPDYHAHRKEHLANQKHSDVRAEIQYNATKQIITWCLGLALTGLAAFWGLK